MLQVAAAAGTWATALGPAGSPQWAACDNFQTNTFYVTDIKTCEILSVYKNIDNVKSTKFLMKLLKLVGR
jgi:hypothetical protein